VTSASSWVTNEKPAHFTSLFGPFRVIKSLIVHVIGQLLLLEIHKFKKTVSSDMPRKQMTSFYHWFLFNDFCI
jgi:hypothetical protein